MNFVQNTLLKNKQQHLTLGTPNQQFSDRYDIHQKLRAEELRSTIAVCHGFLNCLNHTDLDTLLVKDSDRQSCSLPLC